ncbi:MAG: hypothetical protein V4692_04980, partial [Bdellovibrionota bacterium]
GARALTKATKLADTKCSDVSSKLDHSLRRLVSLNCKFNFKLEHYNQLADAANVEIEAENAEAQASK